MSDTQVVWTIAGSDSGGYSGISNDLKTFHHLNVHGCSIITALTSQNTQGIFDLFFVPAKTLTSQILALQHDLPPLAIKIGMLGQSSVIKVIKQFLKTYHGKVVLDSLLISSSCSPLYQADLAEYLPQLITLLPWVDVLTPNLYEAEEIAGFTIKSHEAVMMAAKKILSLGVKSVLIKGGHFADDKMSQDYWSNGTESFWLSSQRLRNRSCRGTGCALSAAITASLALGFNVKDAVVIGKMYVNQGISLAENTLNPGLFAHRDWPEHETYLPYLSDEPLRDEPQKFNANELSDLGLYPIVDSYEWIKKLLPTPVKTLQLRIKKLTGFQLEQEIKRSIELARQHQLQLFINDYWELAIRYGAFGVHLGQEDLYSADMQAIRSSQLHLGVSTHCYYEVARAHTFRPCYLACGPIFPTTSKVMPFAPQGILQLKRWRNTLNYPLVAIGGINQENVREVIATQVEGIAMISAITEAEDPVAATQQFLSAISAPKNCYAI